MQKRSQAPRHRPRAPKAMPRPMRHRTASLASIDHLATLENALLFRRERCRKQSPANTGSRLGTPPSRRRLRQSITELSSMKASEIPNELANAGGNNVGSRRGFAFAWGLAAGVGAAIGALAGRKALMQASVGK